MYRLKLKEMRNRAGFETQQEAADALGMKWRRYSALERGETELKLVDACHICEVFGCSMNELCGWYEDHPRDNQPSERLTRVQSQYDAVSDDFKESVDAVLMAGMAQKAEVVQIDIGEEEQPQRKQA